jgi:type II secretory pathway predicted ATPase ExeA
MKNKTHPDTQLKSLWGASTMPFGKTPTALHRWDGFETAEASLMRMLALRLWGIVHGPNGTGKSQLVHAVAEELPEKAYRVIRLSHSTLSASDLLRSLCHALHIKPAFRRADIVEQIGLQWLKLSPVFPVLFLDEAQNLSAQALEELRLLSCAGLDARNHFSLVLIGDENLMPRLEMGVNHALLQRLGFQVQVNPMNAQQSREYLDTRLKDVGIQSSPFEEAAVNLLVNATDGIPRCLNLLAQAAMQQAMEATSHAVTAKHVQKALEQLRWLAPNHIP